MYIISMDSEYAPQIFQDCIMNKIANSHVELFSKINPARLGLEFKSYDNMTEGYVLQISDFWRVIYATLTF